MHELNSLGYLQDLKTLLRFEINNNDQIRIPNKNVFQNTSLKEISIWNTESGLQDKLTGSWLIFNERIKMWLKTCQNGFELYNYLNYAPYEQKKINVNAISDPDDVNALTDNYKECVRVFCQNPTRDFYCSHPHKYYKVEQVDEKYNKCLAEVTLLKLPALIPELLTGSLDQFNSVVKIEFDGLFETILAPDLFDNLENLRFIDFKELEIPDAINTSIGIMNKYRNVYLVSHKLFRIYSECDHLRVIDMRRSKTTIVQFLKPQVVIS